MKNNRRLVCTASLTSGKKRGHYDARRDFPTWPFGSGKPGMARRCFLWLMTIFLLSGCLMGCGADRRMVERQMWYMDTWITVRLYDTETAEGEKILTATEAVLQEWERRLSATLTDSEILSFRESEGPFCFSDGTAGLIRQALEIAAASGGAFDPTVAPLMKIWEIAEDRQVLPGEEELAEALSHVGYYHLQMTDHVVIRDDPATELDLGGIGKGYAIDRVREQLTAAGVKSALISFGSNVAVIGTKPDGTAFRIGIRDPSDSDGILGYLRMEGAEVLSVSGDYERYYTINGVHYGHILDPATGYPPEGKLHSAAVLCEDGALADALSTAMMVSGEEGLSALREQYSFEAMLIYEDGSIMTEGWRERFSG